MTSTTRPTAQGVLDLDLLRTALAHDQFWAPYLADVDARGGGIHVAVFVEPFLRYVLDGRKTIESRFGTRRTAPYGLVETGDIVLLKASGGPIVGLCQATRVWYYRLHARAWREIRERFGPALAVDNEETFMVARQHAAFATLIQLANVREIPRIPVTKRDRRGWVVLRDSTSPPMLPGLDET